ncbi:MAG: IS21 family transposase [Deltaproteobacteria bacterium]|nr:MAG: IS21 family transposase [Deltaproteobacteria bacterium]TMQ17997.1 MAG: IS21 family transposase [Deltaproteobacteria bacterium]
MAGSPEELAHDVVLLAQQGMSARAIARALRIGRNRVRKILRAHEASRNGETPPSALPAPPVSRPSMLDLHEVFVRNLLARFPDITAQRVYEELCARQDTAFDGGYTIVKDYVRSQRPKPVVEVSTPVEEPDPGKVAECDWASILIDFKNRTRRRLQIFGYALAYSHRRYYRFYDRADFHALLDGHVESFDHLEGIAEECKYDGQKTVVLRWEGQQPIYNPRFIAFATYYLFRPRACRPGHPNDKPHVELSFRALRISFFNGRDFYDLDDLKAQLARWMTGIDDERPQRKKQRRTPLELHAEEQPHLIARPRHPYDTARVVYRVCDLEGFVAWEGNRYSLPVENVTELLPVRITQTEIFVYAQNLKLVARHELHPRGAGEDVVAPGHRPKADRGPGLDQLRTVYRELGDGADDFLVSLERAQPRSAAYHARHILAFRERYQTNDVLAAMDHARQYGAFEYRAVERILIARAAPRRLDEYVAEATEKKLAAIVRQSRTEPRDLSTYDALPNWSRPATPGEPPCPSQRAPAAEPNPSREETAASSSDSETTSSDSD